MISKENDVKERLWPGIALLSGVILILLSLWVLTTPHAQLLGQRLNLQDVEIPFVVKAVHCVRYLFLFGGLTACAGALFWRSFFCRVLVDDLADRVPQSYLVTALLLIPFCFYAFLEWVTFQRFPITPDEFAYLFQAKIFASGHITVPEHPLQSSFRSAFIGAANGRLFSIMPLGWSFLLAAGIWIHAPWLVNPIVSALSVPLVFLIGSRLYNRNTGLLAAVLMSFCPFYVYMSGTYFAHPLSLLLVLLAFYLYVRMVQVRDPWWGYLFLGLLVAMVAIVHHFDAFIFAPMLAVMGFRFLKGSNRTRWKVSLLGIILVGTVLCFTFLLNDRMTGSPFRATHQAYLENDNYLGEIPSTRSLVGVGSPAELKQRTIRLAKQILMLNLVLFPLAPVLLFLPVLSRGRSRYDIFLVACVMCVFIAYLFYWCRGGFQFGPRYYYPLVGIFYLLIVRSFWGLVRFWANTAWGRRMQKATCFGLLIVFVCQGGVTAAAMRIVSDVSEYAKEIEDIGGWFESRGIRNSVIFLRPSAQNRDSDPKDLFIMVRNEPDFSDTNLTAVDLVSENVEVMKYYPDRRYFLYLIDVHAQIRGEPRQWHEIYPPKEE